MLRHAAFVALVAAGYPGVRGANDPPASKGHAGLAVQSWTSPPSSDSKAPRRAVRHTVRHSKVAGNGYLPGSPLYDKQQADRVEGAVPGSASAASAMGLDKLASASGRQVPTSYSEAMALLVQEFVAVLLAVLVYVIFAAAAGWLFLRYLRDVKAERELKAQVQLHPEQKTFSFGILQCEHACGRDWRLCLCAFCCLPVRWAGTVSDNRMRAGPLQGFWSALLTAAFLLALSGPTSGLCGLIMLIVFTYRRQQIRKKYNFESGTVGTMCTDCLAWCCCCYCAALQEARQVLYTAPPAPVLPAGPQYGQVYSVGYPGPPGSGPPGSQPGYPAAQPRPSGAYPSYPGQQSYGGMEGL